MNQHAFNAGYKGFFNNQPEVCQIRNFSEYMRKEYSRGWDAAWFKNLERVCEREERYSKKSSSQAA